MREILFRGFHECENGTQKAYYGGEWHKGEWVCGKSILFLKENGGEYYMPKNDEKCKTIHLENGDIEEINCADYNTAFYKVAPETVSQYTGLDDKHGKKIFECDIFKFKDGYDKGVVRFGQHKSSFNHEPKNVCFFIDWERKDGYATLREDLGYWAESDDVEIIGNKFSNPELLEEENE